MGRGDQNVSGEYQTAHFELGPEPQSIEELRHLQTQTPCPIEMPRVERAEQRGSVNWPVQVLWETSDGRRHALMAQVREVAPTSIYFEIDSQDRLSSPDLLLELEPGQRVSLCAVARVSRVEAKEGKIGIAVVVEDYCCQRVQ